MRKLLFLEQEKEALFAYEHTLLFCWRLKQGLANGTALPLLRNYLQYYWTYFLQPHCQEEEWVLNRLMKKQDRQQVVRMQVEHQKIEERIERILSEARLQKDSFLALYDSLNHHLHWEHEQLFTQLQQSRAASSVHLTAYLLNHKLPYRHDRFRPEFWLQPAACS